jgi:hypothetical protein
MPHPGHQPYCELHTSLTTMLLTYASLDRGRSQEHLPIDALQLTGMGREWRPVSISATEKCLKQRTIPSKGMDSWQQEP